MNDVSRLGGTWEIELDLDTGWWIGTELNLGFCAEGDSLDELCDSIKDIMAHYRSMKRNER
jgi:hypothetical protein